MSQDTDMIPQDKSFVSDIRSIIDAGMAKAYASVNAAMIETYWNIGKKNR